VIVYYLKVYENGGNQMYMLRNTDKFGRIVIPIDVLKCMGAKAGDEVKLTVVDGKLIVEKYEK